MNPFLIAISLVVGGCASVRFSTPTPFQAKDDSGFGLSYNETTSEEGFAMSVFEGNAHTKPEVALRYSLLGAYHRCQEQGSHTIIHQLPVEFSGELTRTQVTTLTSPGPVTGASAQPVPARTYAYPVTVKLPKFATTFRCVKSYRSLAGQPRLEAVNRDLVHPITKDFMGGVLVRSYGDGRSKNGLLIGDVIIELAGHRIETPLQLELGLASLSGQTANLRLIRKSSLRAVKVKAIDLTDTLRQKEADQKKALCQELAQDNLLPDPCRSL